MHDLAAFVDNHDLVDKGHFWSSKGDGSTRIHSRIDRGFANDTWLQQYYLLEVDYLNPVRPLSSLDSVQLG